MYSSETCHIFIKVLQSALKGTPIELPKDMNDMIDVLICMAMRQGVLQLFCRGLKINNYVITSDIKQDIMAELYQYTQNEYTFKLAHKTLSAEKILFIPLKGSVIRDLYPERRMRSCCDVDILVREKDLGRAIKVLVEAGFSTDYKREYHDVVFYYGDERLELHYNICENIPRIDRVLERVWDYIVPLNEYEYREQSSFFAFHILAHMLYHFLQGGCEIKQYIDLWLLREGNMYDEDELLSLLAQCKLKRFYNVICNTLSAWFDDGTPTELTDKILIQVLNGGVSQESKYSDTINMVISGGKVRRIIQSFFLPMREMKWYYPVLNGREYLLPLYYVKRFITKTVGAESNRAKALISINTKKGTEEQRYVVNLLDEMGLG